MTRRDINHTDDSHEACEAFRVRSGQRRHPDIPKMVGAYRFEATAEPLFTNHAAPRP